MSALALLSQYCPLYVEPPVSNPTVREGLLEEVLVLGLLVVVMVMGVMVVEVMEAVVAVVEVMEAIVAVAGNVAIQVSLKPLKDV